MLQQEKLRILGLLDTKLYSVEYELGLTDKVRDSKKAELKEVLLDVAKKLDNMLLEGLPEEFQVEENRDYERNTKEKLEISVYTTTSIKAALDYLTNSIRKIRYESIWDIGFSIEELKAEIEKYRG